MALLQFQVTSLNRTNSSWPGMMSMSSGTDVASLGGGDSRMRNEKMRRLRIVKSMSTGENAASGVATSGVTVTIGKVTEVCKDTFWPIVNAAADKTVVLDMYTQWCGPCKVIAPKYQQLSEKYADVVFLKLDCNQDNKPLAKELGIKVVPTFKILKDNKVVKEVTGAKFDELVAAIEVVRSG